MYKSNCFNKRNPIIIPSILVGAGLESSHDLRSLKCFFFYVASLDNICNCVTYSDVSLQWRKLRVLQTWLCVTLSLSTAPSLISFSCENWFIKSYFWCKILNKRIKDTSTVWKEHSPQSTVNVQIFWLSRREAWISKF